MSIESLTPEERQKTYLEEKARLEARLELESKQPSIWKFAGRSL